MYKLNNASNAQSGALKWHYFYFQEVKYKLKRYAFFTLDNNGLSVICSLNFAQPFPIQPVVVPRPQSVSSKVISSDKNMSTSHTTF